MKTLGKILFFGGLLMAMLVWGLSAGYFPGQEDVGLQVINAPGTTSTSSPASTGDGPVRLLIPTLDIDTDIQHRGITRAGNMAAPDNFSDVSWYKYGTVPGKRGSAVMAGHEDNALALDGVFKHLRDLRAGDDVFVVMADGTKLHFEVIESAIYPYDNSPVERIFNSTSGTFLNLITCAGEWLPQAKTNDQRLVVYTKLVDN